MKKGEKLKQILNKRNITPADFASRLGVSESSVFKYYNKDNFDSELLEKFCSILDISITYFFDNEAKKINTLPKENSNTVASGHHSQITILEHNIHSKEVEIKHLKQILEEKERLIQILLKSSGK